MSDESSPGSNNADSPPAEQQAAPPKIPYLFLEMFRNDKYMMYNFKINECDKFTQYMIPHEASVCPLVHEGQISRRHPRKSKYYPKLCPDLGDCYDEDCKYAHNIYEYCLHPKIFSRSRCIDGMKCKSYPCLFAHDPDKLLAAMKPPLPPPPRRTPPPRRLPPLPYRPSPFEPQQSSTSGAQDGASTSGSKAVDDHMSMLIESVIGVLPL